MVEGELFKIFSEFPTNKHVMEICKPNQGKRTCRYLTTGSCWKCLKMNNSKKVIIDERVKSNQMSARADNCIGLLGLIIKKKEELRNKKAAFGRLYFTIKKTLKEIEIVKEIEIEGNILRLTMNWKNKKGKEEGRKFDFEIDKLNVVLNSKFVIFFQKLDLGENSIKKFTIFF